MLTFPYQSFEKYKEFEGEYIILCDDQVIAHGSNVQEEYKTIKSKYPKKMVTIAFIPTSGDHLWSLRSPINQKTP